MHVMAKIWSGCICSITHHRAMCVFEARCHTTTLPRHSCCTFTMYHMHTIHHHHLESRHTIVAFSSDCICWKRWQTALSIFIIAILVCLTRAIPMRTHIRINYETIRRPNQTKGEKKKTKSRKMPKRNAHFVKHKKDRFWMSYVFLYECILCVRVCVCVCMYFIRVKKINVRIFLYLWEWCSFWSQCTFHFVIHCFSFDFCFYFSDLIFSLFLNRTSFLLFYRNVRFSTADIVSWRLVWCRRFKEHCQNEERKRINTHILKFYLNA